MILYKTNLTQCRKKYTAMTNTLTQTHTRTHFLPQEAKPLKQKLYEIYVSIYIVVVVGNKC